MHAASRDARIGADAAKKKVSEQKKVLADLEKKVSNSADSIREAKEDVVNFSQCIDLYKVFKEVGCGG